MNRLHLIFSSYKANFTQSHRCCEAKKKKKTGTVTNVINQEVVFMEVVFYLVSNLLAHICLVSSSTTSFDNLPNLVRIHYLQGLFYSQKNFPTQITQIMIQGHILPHTGVNSLFTVCNQNAITVKQSRPIPTKYNQSIQQKRKQCVFYSPIQIHILFEDHSCQTAFWPQNTVEHLGGRACASKIRWRTRTRKQLFKQSRCSAFFLL